MDSAWAAGAIGDFGWDLAPSSLAHGEILGEILEILGMKFWGHNTHSHAGAWERDILAQNSCAQNSRRLDHRGVKL